ncbi:MAG: RNA 2',3'-cyclic phosphodiesterase [Candidatus Aureabacteria bacterium]|nr:RNA 2',3'-cyclic phosphodiesterase [Candidatus Auribacterota bacterium]
MSVRLFVAIELDEAAWQALGRIQARLTRELPAVRWVKPEAIHLTLKFLGDTREDDVERVKESLKQSASGIIPFAVHLSGLGAFPNSRNPRVIWVGVEENTGMLSRLVEQIEARLSPLGFPREERGFTPHLTLGRVKEKGGARGFESLLPALSRCIAHEHIANALSLIRSDLSPQGPTYTTLHAVTLAAGQS